MLSCVHDSSRLGGRLLGEPHLHLVWQERTESIMVRLRQEKVTCSRSLMGLGEGVLKLRLEPEPTTGVGP